MADSKISALTALAEAPASGDLLVLVDVSDTTMAASGTDKKITYANLTSALVSGATPFATSSAQTFTNGINGGTAANDDITINGTSHATKASSYVNLQPSGGLVAVGASVIAVSPFAQAVINSNFGVANNTGGYDSLVLSNGGTNPGSSLIGPAISFKSATYGTTATYATGRILSYFDTSGGSNPNYPGCILALQYPTADNTFSNGIIIKNGSVGIATTSFTDPISGTSKFRAVDGTMVLSFRDQSGGAGWFALSNGTITTYGGHTNADQGGVFGTYTNHVVTFRTNNAAKMYIDHTQGVYIAGTGNFGSAGVIPAFTGGLVVATGNVGFGVLTPTAVLHVAASSTARASACVNVGTAPTTPVAGDIWNDGALSFYNADATTNAIVNHLRLSRDSTGTAAAGLGLGILAELESTTTSRQSAGRLTWEWATATHASRAAKGKLTAYYTSTEREAITWVADSAGVKVGINQPSPTALLHLSDSSTSGTQVLFVNSDTGGKSYLMLSSGSGNEGGAGKYQIVENASGNRLTYDGANNRLGIGTTTPQSLIHMHDGSGGFLFVNQASVGGTLVTVIPDAAGDVTEKIFFVGWCTNSAPFSADVAPTTLTVSSSTTKTDGTNTLTIAVTAGGAFTLQATGGAATWNVNLWVFWR